MRVLVVEDGTRLAEVLSTGLVAEGFNVDVVDDGMAGYWQAREGAYDVMVLDILLPSLNGYKVAESLRRDEVWMPGTASTVSDAGTSPSTSAAGATGDRGDAGAASSGSEETTLELTITLDDPSAAEAYTAASVDVLFTSSQREDVLTVPVTALLALLGGGYAVEVPLGDGAAGDADSGDAGSATRLVQVEPGMFADGFVEVTGEGIDEGTEVVVPE